MSGQQNELSIDLINLIGHLLIRWRIILCVSIITAVSGGLFGMVKYAISNNNIVNEPNKETVDAKAKLSEDQISEVEEYYSVITAYDEIIAEQKRFNRESYIMSLKPELAVKYDLQYLIKTEMESLSSFLSINSLLSEDDYKRMADLLGPDIGKEGIYEAVNVGNEKSNNVDSILCIQETGDRYLHEVSLSLAIIAPDKDYCERFVDIIDKAVERKVNELKNQGILIDYSSVYKGYNPNAREDVCSIQQNRFESMKTLISNRSTFTKSISDSLDESEKVYMYELLGNSTDDIQDNVIKEIKSSNKIGKYLLAGLFLGLLLSICWFAVIYIFDGRVHTIEDLDEYLGISVLQTINEDFYVNASLEKDIIRKFGYRLIGAFDRTEDSIEMLLDEVCNILKSEKISQIYIAVDGESNSAIKFAGRIIEMASREISYIEGRMLLDADNMRRFLSSDCVLLLPAIDVTKRKNIIAFKDICERNNKSIIGSAPVRTGKMVNKNETLQKQG